MHYLSPVDYAVIIIYVAILIGLGFYLKKRASASLEDYFIGGRSLPWWALGVSGMASFLDVTGTMVIVSFLYMIGPRGLFVEFRGGAVLVLVFMLLWTGKWHRRSGCITGAEWMIFRFGGGSGGKFARVVTAIAGASIPIGMLGYLFVGMGMFLSQFIDLPPTYCAIGMISVATIYTMASGFYGVVFTDLFQSGVILIAVIGVCVMAVSELMGYDGDIGALATSVTGVEGWATILPPARMEMPAGYKQFNPLLLMAALYLLRNVLDGSSSGGDPKYFGARNDRECGLLTFLWTWLMMFRWPMMMAFAVLGIFLVNEKFKDQEAIAGAARLINESRRIQEDYPDLAAQEHRWRDVRASITPQKYPDLCKELEAVLGAEYQYKLKLISSKGTVDPEGILPAVMLFKVKRGFRGLLLIALIAASMSTFDSTVNGAAGLFTRDIYQAFMRPKAGNRELIYATYIFIGIMVSGGCLMGYYATSITNIWGWITMGLGVGLMIPRILRLYWWRFNAGGVVFGTLAGMIAAFIQRAVHRDMPDMQQFAMMAAIGFTASIIGTYLARPTDRNVLEHFYRKTRPFGFWGPVRDVLTPDEQKAMRREHFYDVISVPFVMGWQITLFMLPMQMVVGAWTAFSYTLPVFLTCLCGVYVFWYRNLPPASNPNFFDAEAELPTERAGRTMRVSLKES